MRDKILSKLAFWQAKYPIRLLAVVFVLTLGFAYSASNIKQSIRWSDMLPEGHQSTLQFEKVLEEFKSASNMVVVLEGEQSQMKEFSELLVPKLKELKDPADGEYYTKRVEYKQEIEFLKQHGLKLIKAEDLKNMKDIFMDPNLSGLIENINNSFEKEYIEDEGSLSSREKEDSAFSFLDSIENLIIKLDSNLKGLTVSEEDIKESADMLLFGEKYLLSYGKDAQLVIAIPNFSMVDMPKIMDYVAQTHELIDTLLIEFPEVRAGLTGMIPIQYDETNSINQSLGYTTIIALIAVLVLLVVAFRMWVAPVFGILTLIIGVIWSIGLATFTVGSLNMMTSIFSVILIGLGVDFGIHIISGFTENRALGISVQESLENTYRCSGKGIITGALTTAIAFTAIIIARTRGMKEMGIVLGGGVVMVLIVTFLVLPSLLVIRELIREKISKKKNREIKTKDISWRYLGNISETLGKKYKKTIITASIITICCLALASKISYDQNYYNMEPKGLLSVKLQDLIIDKFDLSIDSGMVLADSIKNSKTISESLKDKSIVASVEDISRYLPSIEEQSERIEYIKTIKTTIISKKVGGVSIDKFLKELERLEMNVIEMQDMAFLGGQDKIDKKCTEIIGDPEDKTSKNTIAEFIDSINSSKGLAAERLAKYQTVFSPYFKKTVLDMGSEQIISIADLPDSVIERYANETRDLFMVTVYPKLNIWKDRKNIDRFSDVLEEASPRATGMVVIMKYLMDIMGVDGRRSLMLTVIVVFLLLWFDFGRPSYAIIAMIPLLVGTIWMLGIMKLFGMQFTIMNVMGLPLIIGIGIDDGVHIVHRWQVEGEGQLFRIFASTGKAILLTSLTTMLAFGSLMFSVYRGFGSLGSLMFIGVGACFITTVILLSAIIGKIDN